MWRELAAMVLASAAAPSARPATSPQPPPAGSTFRDCDACPQMTRLPAGAFEMGDATDPRREDERPVHTVTLPAFSVGTYEVTHVEYAAFVAATGRPSPGLCRTDRNRDGRYEDDYEATWQDPGFPWSDRHPVTCVSWADAAAYAGWLAKTTGKPYRLLSEAEWEYAARAGTTSQYWWGDDENQLCPYANGPDQAARRMFPTWSPAKLATCDDGQAMAAPVGSFKPNRFGLYDMAGNVWEWTQDCYAPSYEPQPQDGSAYEGGACARRVLRGGSWVYGLQDLRSAQRNPLPPPAMRGGDIGFRVARSL
jgi:formylglycine-generating enzyme required for sulfatase activity